MKLENHPEVQEAEPRRSIFAAEIISLKNPLLAIGHKKLKFFSHLVGKKDPRIPGFKCLFFSDLIRALSIRSTSSENLFAIF